MDITDQLTRELEVETWQVENTLGLLGDGATVPFIARYRKERTGSLNETQIRELARKSAYYRELDGRRLTILQSIAGQGKLTPRLRARLESVLAKGELEDLYLPYKPKRATRASKARDAGLGPLSRWVHACGDRHCDLRREARKFVDPGKGIDTPEQALQGASDLLAEELAEDAEVRLRLRELAWQDGSIVSRATKEFAAQKTKFSMYHEFSEPVRRLPSHRVLAMLRGDLGLPTLNDIAAELRKPGRDPRDSFQVASFADGVTEIEDLCEGMQLQGTVTNVTNFGAFVDVGVHQDGLVHISEMAGHFVRDPRDVVRAGQVVTVTVLSVDTDLRRIGLRLAPGSGRGR